MRSPTNPQRGFLLPQTNILELEIHPHSSGDTEAPDLGTLGSFKTLPHTGTIERV